MNACVITIGNEILAGDIHDTNFREITEFLRDSGVRVRHHESVPDEVPAISHAVCSALSRERETYGLILLTGGLGPTPDDVTREGVAHALGIPQKRRDDLARELRDRFEAAGYHSMPENNYRQADLPEGARALANPLGSAPGFALSKGSTWIAAVPGVPQEMRLMVRQEVIPLLVGETDLVPPTVRVLRTQGIGESSLAEKIGDLLDIEDVEVGFYPKNPGVDIKLTYAGAGGKAQDVLDVAESRLRRRIPSVIYAVGSTTLAEHVGVLLRGKKWRIAVAESCTGGAVASLLTQTPGASDYFERGVVAYSNATKAELLGVPETVMRAHGAVSHEVAEAMAQGLLARTAVDVTLATTGIAGPTGGTEEKPVGLVYVAVATAQETKSWALRSHGNRGMVIQRSSVGALNRLRLELMTP